MKTANDFLQEQISESLPDTLLCQVIEAMLLYADYRIEQKLKIASVVRPEVESAHGGELLQGEGMGQNVRGDFSHCYIRTKIGCHCTDKCGYDETLRGISDEEVLP